MMLKPEKIDDLTPERHRAIMQRSMEDISTIFEDVRKIVLDVKARGDGVALEHYRKHKQDISVADLEVTDTSFNPQGDDAQRGCRRHVQGQPFREFLAWQRDCLVRRNAWVKRSGLPVRFFLRCRRIS